MPFPLNGEPTVGFKGQNTRGCSRVSQARESVGETLPDSNFLAPLSCSVFFLPVKGFFLPIYALQTTYSLSREGESLKQGNNGRERARTTNENRSTRQTKAHVQSHVISFMKRAHAHKQNPQCTYAVSERSAVC